MFAITRELGAQCFPYKCSRESKAGPARELTKKPVKSEDFFTFTCTLREASHIDFVHEKRHMHVLLETPHPHLETSRTFFDSAEASEALFIVQV